MERHNEVIDIKYEVVSFINELKKNWLSIFLIFIAFSTATYLYAIYKGKEYQSHAEVYVNPIIVSASLEVEVEYFDKKIKNGDFSDLAKMLDIRLQDAKKLTGISASMNEGNENIYGVDVFFLDSSLHKLLDEKILFGLNNNPLLREEIKLKKELSINNIEYINSERNKVDEVIDDYKNINGNHGELVEALVVLKEKLEQHKYNNTVMTNPYVYFHKFSKPIHTNTIKKYMFFSIVISMVFTVVFILFKRK